MNMSLISEVTERARKLRNQYKLQAQSLRAHIEMRINRVPSSLRRTKMGDLHSAHMRQSESAEQRNQMNINEPLDKDISKPLPPGQPLEASGNAKKSKKAMDRIDITSPPKISKTLIKPTPAEIPNASNNAQALERTKLMGGVDQNNIYAWRESKSGKYLAKPMPAERSVATSNSRKAPEKRKPVVNVDKSDNYGPPESIFSRGPANAISEGRVIALAGRANPKNNDNMMDISESHKRIPVQLSAKPSPVERQMDVSNTGIITSARIGGTKRKR